MKRSENVKISYPFLRRCSLIYICLPLLCFFVGWLKWYWMALSCIALVVCFLSSENLLSLRDLICRKKRKVEEFYTLNPYCDESIYISKKVILFIVLIICVFCILCGIGRFWAQSSDYTWRNAIFRDLITHQWPVKYDRFDGALTYYIGMWLPVAIPGKLVYLISGDSGLAFLVSNISLFMYFVIGLTILILLLLLHLKISAPKQVFLVVLGMIFFSGMDIVGCGGVIDFHVSGLHLEWWAGFATFQYSSLTTCVCWVFNQTLIPWICTTLLLHERKVSNYVLIGMACLLSGPFPFIGFFGFCCAIGVKRFVSEMKARNLKSFIREVFSISNVCTSLFIFPIVGSYLSSNTYMGESDGNGSIFSFTTWDMNDFFLYVYFLLLEFGIYALLIAKANKKNFLFYVTIVQLCMCPLINIGVFSDFTMRASIPAIFMMFILCYEYIIKEKPDLKQITGSGDDKDLNLKYVVSKILPYAFLVCLLIIGAVTPMVEFTRGFIQVQQRGIDDIQTDMIITFDQDTNPLNPNDSWPPTTFLTLDPNDSVFFKYFAR